MCVYVCAPVLCVCARKHVASYYPSCFRLEDSDIEMSTSQEEGEESSLLESDIEVTQNTNRFDSDWRDIALSFERADPVCRKLNELIRNGKIPRDKIFYKYLSDTINIFFDPGHKYDDDVKEFFASIADLGGRRTYNLVRGPMKQLSTETKMNLGGPSIETLRKRLPSYTTDSGVLKYLSELYYQLTISESPEKPCPIIDKANLTVYPVALGYDGTALKPAMQFDERYKVNVGLKESVSLDFVQNNQYLSKDILPL